MSKLSKQDKIDIYNLWKNYQVGSGELSRRYDVNISVLNYLVALIDRHGFSILNKSYITYSAEFKEQAIRRVIVNHESLYSVALDLGVVALNAQDVKADQTTDQSVDTAKLKQTADNIVPVINIINGADNNLSKQTSSETNDKVQLPVNDNK
ncbi:transposase [Lactobacillus sp. ESL0228]|uniref:transposase n=1 Tax=Lactobacillus sp. ESL0228 TaxID=2069352 RepID=UPI000EFAF8E8|nr:transposase [Lactobacillus sp. ESL0228]RMC47286.1 transposase [Lactobacillus sp. ESL0228]